jgi:hypothetical protein
MVDGGIVIWKPVSGVAGGGGAIALGASTRLCLAQATLLVRETLLVSGSHI